MTTTRHTITDGKALAGRLRGLLALTLQGLLLGWVVFAAVAVAANVAQRSLFRRAEARPWTVSMADVRADDARMHTINDVALTLLAVTGVAFVAWLFVEYRQVERRGGRVRHRTGWAIGGWVVPFANLYIPFMVVDDVWRDAAGEPGASDRTSSVPVVPLWWAGWLGGWFLAAGANAKLDNATTVDDLLAANMLYLVRDVIAAATAVLAIVIVQRVRRRSLPAVSPGDAEFWARTRDQWPAPIEGPPGEGPGS